VDMLAMAAGMDAYARLIALPEKRRNYIVKQIRRALSLEASESSDRRTLPSPPTATEVKNG